LGSRLREEREVGAGGVPVRHFLDTNDCWHADLARLLELIELLKVADHDGRVPELFLK
jgi:hypothetical protein